MTLISTTISDANATVHMRYADDPDPEKAKGWIDFQVPVAPLMLKGNEPLGFPADRLLRAIQAAALRYLRDRADEEIQRLLSF